MTDVPQVTLTAEQLLALINPEPLKCGNNCTHGCDVPVQPGHNWINVATQAGWIVVIWESRVEHIDHNRHGTAFCDMGCLYEFFRGRVLVDPSWHHLLPTTDTGCDQRDVDVVPPATAEC